VAKGRVDFGTFAGKLLAEGTNDVDLQREGLRVLAQALMDARARTVAEGLGVVLWFRFGA
jgi:hypothetical protein